MRLLLYYKNPSFFIFFGEGIAKINEISEESFALIDAVGGEAEFFGLCTRMAHESCPEKIIMSISPDQMVDFYLIFLVENEVESLTLELNGFVDSGIIHLAPGTMFPEAWFTETPTP